MNLTVREKDVVRLLTAGMRNAEIGKHMGITEDAVKNHLRHIYDKLGFSNRVELAMWELKRRNDALHQ